jgi:hypothetical protein
VVVLLPQQCHDVVVLAGVVEVGHGVGQEILLWGAGGVGPQTAGTWASSRFSLVTGGRDRAGPNGAGDYPGRAAEISTSHGCRAAPRRGRPRVTRAGSQECRAVKGASR